jgi:hypothetical protein
VIKCPYFLASVYLFIDFYINFMCLMNITIQYVMNITIQYAMKKLNYTKSLFIVSSIYLQVQQKTHPSTSKTHPSTSMKSNLLDPNHLKRTIVHLICQPKVYIVLGNLQIRDILHITI